MILMNIIGAGHVGQTIGHLLMKSALVRIGAVYNQTEESAFNAIEFMGGGQYCSSIRKMPHAQLTLITTPDDCILSACTELSANEYLRPRDVVVHFSGSCSSDSLWPAKQKGCHVASVHPMRSFARPALSVNEYQGTYCAMEGDAAALDRIGALLQGIGSITYLINKEKKSLYHAAGVFASNYVVTLSQQALDCLLEAGVEQGIAIDVITGLMRSTVSNLERTSSPKEALTGPIQRGDCSAIEGHLKALSTSQQKVLYALLGNATLPLTSLDEGGARRVADTLCSV